MAKSRKKRREREGSVAYNRANGLNKQSINQAKKAASQQSQPAPQATQTQNFSSPMKRTSMQRTTDGSDDTPNPMSFSTTQTNVRPKKGGGGTKGQTSTTSTSSGGTAGGSPQGLFNFQSLMEQFYNWKPSSDDTAGQQLKNTFQGDFIQTVLNNQMSKDLAYTNAEIATGQMTTAAALELANQTQIMKDEFDYGMTKMGAEYDYQSKFATDQANIKLNEMSHGADLQQNQTKLEGEENRLGIKEQGHQNMLLQDKKNQGALDQIDAQGSIDKQLQNIKGEQAIDQLKQSGINDQALQELKNSGAIDQITKQGDIDKGLQELKNSGALDQIGAQGAEALKQIEAQGFLDNQLQKMKGEQALSQIGAQGDVDLSKIKETGNQERLGMKQQTEEDTKKQKRDSGMARSLAGMF